VTKILLVEDDHHLSESLAEIMEMEGHRVWVATDGANAWQLLQKQRFDVLITDYGLPEMDGQHLITHVQNTPALGELKIIMISGHNITSPFPQIPLLYKPFNIRDILEIVER
jgi:CheY-like chemotaxis protein